MKYLKDFLENNKDSEVFSILSCSKAELEILEHLMRKYLAGISQVGCFELLSQIYDTKELSFLEGLNDVKNLIELGYISASYAFFKEHSKLSKLGLLQADLSLCDAFLHILEAGAQPLSNPKEPYNDHLEYLKDQFLRVELYARRANTSDKSKASEQIKALEKIIASRLKLSKIALPCEQILKENAFEAKERIVFFALLKEEYEQSESGSLRDLGALLALISKDDMERMKNRSMLEDGSRLIESGVVEYDEVLTPFGALSRTFFISEDTLGEIMHPKSAKTAKKIKLENIVKNSEIFELITPSSDLSDVVLNEQTRALLENILRQLDKNVQARLASWGMKPRKNIDAKVIFYGPPGTGKTMSAYCLAKSLKKQVLSFDCSKILSKYVGESEQNVRKIFDSYREICAKTKSEPVLLLNEADQFLSSRLENSSSGSEQMHNQMQNIFLEQIEKFQGVLIATTNFIQSFDKAFSRRFEYKIEFKKPQLKERIQIWQKVLPKNAKFEESFDINTIAKYELSGASIVLVMKNVALKTAISDDGVFRTSAFID
ncbi:MAG: ATP-binding protein, partial [Campylobacter sp.]|nr:ATP-binding protein [Campylobacter sp.]